MYKYQIELVTTKDVMDFVNIATETEGSVKLKDDDGFCVNGKSILGAMASVEWESLYVESDNDIYSKIQRFIKE